MSTFAVTAETLTILPHPNADALELAEVGLYRAVVQKGKYQTGDVAIYIPEQAILPEPLIEELGLTGRLAGSAANRVKAIRLRGELSQGIVCLPSALAGVDLAAAATQVGPDGERQDFATILEIKKWVPEIPANMAGELFAAPRIIDWVDIENVKRFPDVFEPGEPVVASEKTHGTCALACADFAATDPQDAFLVTSKGFGGKRLALKEDPNNLYWRALRQHDVEQKLRAIADILRENGQNVVRLAIFGEVYGAGVQDLTYGVVSRNTPGYAAFDAFVETTTESGRWFDQAELRELTATVGIPMVPELYNGPYDYAAIAAVSEGKTVLGAEATQAAGQKLHIREGVVVRPAHERTSPQLGGRAIAKFINPDYLLRKDGTEFE